jgi:hypothetical protein
MPTLPLHHVESLSRYNSVLRSTRDEQPQEFDSQFLLNTLLASLAGGILLYLVHRNSDYLRNSSARIYNRLSNLFTPTQIPIVPSPPSEADVSPSVTAANEDASIQHTVQSQASEHEVIPLPLADAAAESKDDATEVKPTEENPDDFDKDAESDFSAVPPADSEEVQNTMRRRK